MGLRFGFVGSDSRTSATTGGRVSPAAPRRMTLGAWTLRGSTGGRRVWSLNAKITRSAFQWRHGLRVHPSGNLSPNSTRLCGTDFQFSIVTSPGPGRDQRPAYWSVMPASSENGRPRCTARRLANCRSGCMKRIRRRTDMIARSAAYFSPGVAALAYHSLSIDNSSARGFSLSAGTLFATYSSVRSASAIFSSAVRAGG